MPKEEGEQQQRLGLFLPDLRLVVCRVVCICDLSHPHAHSTCSIWSWDGRFPVPRAIIYSARLPICVTYYSMYNRPPFPQTVDSYDMCVTLPDSEMRSTKVLGPARDKITTHPWLYSYILHYTYMSADLGNPVWERGPCFTLQH